MEAISTRNTCACKGIRRCLLCEDPETRCSQNSLVAAKGYFYCSSCNGTWSDDNAASCHPMHSGEFLSFLGIDIIPEFVTELEEQRLCESIDAGQWNASQSGRYKQDFGPKVNFKKMKVRVGSFAGLPVYSRELVNRFAIHSCLTGFVPVELCNLEYLPERGSAIDPHLDDWWLWGERLVTLNLLSDTVLTFVDDNQPAFSVLVPLARRSLIVVSGPARYKWKHAIQRLHVTSRRIAMTFRELSAEFAVGGTKESIGKELITVASNYIS